MEYLAQNKREIGKLVLILILMWAGEWGRVELGNISLCMGRWKAMVCNLQLLSLFWTIRSSILASSIRPLYSNIKSLFPLLIKVVWECKTFFQFHMTIFKWKACRADLVLYHLHIVVESPKLRMFTLSVCLYPSGVLRYFNVLNFTILKQRPMCRWYRSLIKYSNRQIQYGSGSFCSLSFSAADALKWNRCR